VNASIRLAVLLLLAALTPSCARTGTPAGAPAPRLVREPLVGFDDANSHPTGTTSPQEARPRERELRAVWRVNAAGR
jgi:hypothetical protein